MGKSLGKAIKDLPDVFTVEDMARPLIQRQAEQVAVRKGQVGDNKSVPLLEQLPQWPRPLG